MTTTTVLLVPRRDDKGHRDRLWAWCRDRWETYFPDLAIFEGHHTEGPFNRSAAINTAARLAGDWDYGIVIDSDVFLRESQVRKAIDTVKRTGRVTWAHRRWRGFHQDHTNRVLHPKNPLDFGAEVTGDMDIFVERTNPLSWSCCVVIPRRVWDDMGGFDERFVGWGFEDMAFKSLITGMYGWERIEGDVYHLWHPRSGERITKGEPAETASPEYLTNARLGRRYMVAAYRDVGIGDEPGEILPDELRRKHVANLMRDDAKLKMHAARYRLPDWSDWWPTLEELQDGAAEYRREAHRPPVTVIVHTGGDPESWPVRSEYLRRSLASLSEHVQGRIVQRVVYSDWGDDFANELASIAREFGFYVAGEGHHGYTGSMQRLWRYLGKRAQGRYVFLVEDDFTYERPVDLDAMGTVLAEHPQLTQLALLRDAVYPREQERGGILGWPRESFTQAGVNGTHWLEHRNFWTANPSLFRLSLTDSPWPRGESSEKLFADNLFRRPEVRSAFWGDGAEPSIRHIGQVRAGTGY